MVHRLVTVGTMQHELFPVRLPIPVFLLARHRYLEMSTIDSSFASTRRPPSGPSVLFRLSSTTHEYHCANAGMGAMALQPRPTPASQSSTTPENRTPAKPALEPVCDHMDRLSGQLLQLLRHDDVLWAMGLMQLHVSSGSENQVTVIPYCLLFLLVPALFMTVDSAHMMR